MPLQIEEFSMQKRPRILGMSGRFKLIKRKEFGKKPL